MTRKKYPDKRDRRHVKLIDLPADVNEFREQDNEAKQGSDGLLERLIRFHSDYVPADVRVGTVEKKRVRV